MIFHSYVSLPKGIFDDPWFRMGFSRDPPGPNETFDFQVPLGPPAEMESPTKVSTKNTTVRVILTFLTHPISSGLRVNKKIYVYIISLYMYIRQLWVGLFIIGFTSLLGRTWVRTAPKFMGYRSSPTSILWNRPGAFCIADKCQLVDPVPVEAWSNSSVPQGPMEFQAFIFDDLSEMIQPHQTFLRETNIPRNALA